MHQSVHRQSLMAYIVVASVGRECSSSGGSDCVESPGRPCSVTRSTADTHHADTMHDGQVHNTICTCNFVTFNTVPSNRNTLGSAFFQSLDSTVEDCLILVLQPATCSVDNILIVNKFPSFHEFLQFCTVGQV